MTSPAGAPRVIELPEVASLLSLPEDGVRALATAGYLRPADGSGGRFALGDVKALLARLSDGGQRDVFSEDPRRVDPQALLDALDGRSEEMARRAYDIFQTVFPEASSWSLSEQARFVEQARSRLEAILAVTAHGEHVDLTEELEAVGAAAAWSGSPLPQLLVTLRISRDLVVQTAVEVAEERGRHWGLALSLLLTRVLPAIDRLTDAIAQGYWRAVVAQEEESRVRHESVVEHASDGVYELDLDGRVRYANPSLAVILGRRLEEIEGERIQDVLTPVASGGALELLTATGDGGSRNLELTVARADGVQRVLDIRTLARHDGTGVAGFQGVVRDITAATEIEAQKNEFLALITHDLRQPLTAILGLGVTLETYADELPVDRTRRMGASIRQQSERIARLADDLHDVSRIEARSLLLNPRPVDLAGTVLASLDTVLDAREVEVRVPGDVVVLADSRRLEQVVANLVENALVHGRPPVVIEAHVDDDAVEIRVVDEGDGVPEALVPTLFSRLRTGPDRERGRGSGLGLFLVRGLVEAMGGRVRYEAGSGGGACFALSVPRPRARPPRS